MLEPTDTDNLDTISNVIEHSIVADADTPAVARCHQLFEARWSALVFSRKDGIDDAIRHIVGEAFHAILTRARDSIGVLVQIDSLDTAAVR